MRIVKIIIIGLLFWIVQACVSGQIIPNTIVHGKQCRFTFQNNSANTVNLVGSFNNWDTVSLPMRKIDKNTWSISINLPKGVYYYQFVINKRVWVVPPYAQAYTNDGFGGKNAVVIIQNGSK